MKFKTDSVGAASLRVSGSWTIQSGLRNTDEIAGQIASLSSNATITVDGSDISEWDSSLITFLLSIKNIAQSQNKTVDLQQCPEGAVRLVSLAEAVPEREGVAKTEVEKSPLEAVGQSVISSFDQFVTFAAFLGDSLLAVKLFFTGKAVYRKPDFIAFLKDAGPSSLGIVTLISVLIGMIMAFVGAVQLKMFGASIYVASLVGLAMAREMAAMMTGIIMAGRTGAAYAAQLGSMQVNEEIDALKTMGVSPIEFLVLPRLLALVIMMPLLTIYANLMGILGGAAVSMVMLDLTWSMYINQMIATVPLMNFVVGIVKSVLFAILVALSGCFMGMNSGRSASAVGQATTSAVVMGIVLIIVCDALVTIVTTVVGI